MADPTNTQDENNDAPNYLEMSDEDLMKAGPPKVVEAVEQDENRDDPKKDEPEVDNSKPDPEKDEDEDEDDKPEGEKPEGEEDPAGEKPEKEKPTDEKKSDKEDPKDPAKEKEEKKPDPEKEVVVDFESEYKRLLAPFKANGREIQVKSVDDAIGLMQMGANYNKKMAALKPSLKLLKMLESSDLLDEAKISYLIDLEKKDPAAIQKLVSESGIDPMDLNAEEAKKYKPTTRTVNDAEIDLDTTLEDLRDSPSYTRMLDVVSNKWDAASKNIVAQSPQVLRVIDSHIASGIYDLITAEVESERVFGRLNGLSSIEAYKQVGDAMQAAGRFNHIGAPSGNPKQKEVVQPKPKATDDDKLKDKKRAASSTKPTGAAAAKDEDFNPLALSDADFLKAAAPKFS